MISTITIKNVRERNKEIIEETEQKINNITRENLELYRQIKVGKDAETQLKKNQRELETLMTLYLDKERI